MAIDRDGEREPGDGERDGRQIEVTDRSQTEEPHDIGDQRNENGKQHRDGLLPVDVLRFVHRLEQESGADDEEAVQE